MIDTKTLRNKILDLAISGKLTEQLPEDGNAEDLYAQIQEEKARLIAEDKIKKEKPLPPIVEDEIPFDIPESWKWVRIGQVSWNHGQKIPKDAFSYIDVGTLDNINHKLSNSENIIEAKNTPSRARKIVKYGDVLYSTVRPYLHNICVINKAFSKEPIASTAFCVMCVSNALMVNNYLFYCLLSSYFDKYANGDPSKGTLYPAIGEKDFLNGLIPLPPLAEQKRIVSAVEDAFAVIDKIEKAQESYYADQEVLKNKIIDAGIRGKLTEQLPEDGNAEDLYAQIQEEKAKLIAEGKIKKEKQLPPITEEEIPFEIPDNWKWVRWGELSQEIQYGYNAPAQNSGRIKMVRISDIQDGNVIWNKVPYCIIQEEEIGKYLLKPNDILFARTGGTVGKSYLVKDIPENAVYAGYLIRTRYSSLLSPEYMKFFMDSRLYWQQLQDGTIATAQPNCNGKTLAKMILPLPPVEEQKRISMTISKLQTSMALC